MKTLNINEINSVSGAECDCILKYGEHESIINTETIPCFLKNNSTECDSYCCQFEPIPELERSDLTVYYIFCNGECPELQPPPIECTEKTTYQYKNNC